MFIAFPTYLLIFSGNIQDIIRSIPAYILYVNIIQGTAKVSKFMEMTAKIKGLLTLMLEL